MSCGERMDQVFRTEDKISHRLHRRPSVVNAFRLHPTGTRRLEGECS